MFKRYQFIQHDHISLSKFRITNERSVILIAFVAQQQLCMRFIRSVRPS